MTGSDRAVFRLPLVALLIPAVLAIFATPLATVGGGWIWLYVLPVLVLIYVLITCTVADPGGLRTTGITGVKRMTWTEMDGLEFTGTRWAVAVALDGRRLRLPMVRPRDLPRLAAVSGGSLHFDLPGAAGSPATADTPTTTPAPATTTPTSGTPEPDSSPATAIGEGRTARPDGATLDLPQVPSSAPEGDGSRRPAE